MRQPLPYLVVLVIACALTPSSALQRAKRAPAPPAPHAPAIELVPVPAGSYVMGSSAEADEQPARTVTISLAFSISAHEITQAQWIAVMGHNPSQFDGAELPVDRVTWDEADAFCKKLSALTGKAYRLPTEAEWEYACRAGSTTAWSFGDAERDLERYAWFDTNGRKQTHAVGARKPNAWGLYDMHGNVWEWCSDWYDAAYYASGPATDPRGPATGEMRVMRGGSYGADAVSCRSSNRFYATSDQRLFATGVRVVLASS
jgi:formylglycine-generating enzyme required for sulfatase activity